MSFKTTVNGYLMICDVIQAVFFDRKIEVFQQILVRVNFILQRPEPEPLVFENIANHFDDFTKKRTIKDI